MRRAAISTVLALLALAACGGGGGGGGSHATGEPTPGATATPLATPSPIPTTSLVLTIRAADGPGLAAASFAVGYEAGRGTFTGSGAQAQCRLASADTLAVNDDDAGTLRVALLPADPARDPALALPTTLTCAFDESGGALSAAELRISGKRVGVLDASGGVVAGDPSRLDVR